MGEHVCVFAFLPITNVSWLQWESATDRLAENVIGIPFISLHLFIQACMSVYEDVSQ